MADDSTYIVCERCVMDSSVPDITFDEIGICNYCEEYSRDVGALVTEKSDSRNVELDHLISSLKEQGKGKRYDCVVGVSGGIDSSWALVKSLELGLRPLAVHMDNGWNSELAQNNIANLVRHLGIDLYTYVINWDEYRSLMQSFFDANVIDIEILYDNAMAAVNFSQANLYGIKYILGGTNQITEGLRMPSSWNWFKYDKRNIKAVGSRFGAVKIDTFPAFGTLDYIYYHFVKGIRWTSFLDYFDYNKSDAVDQLKRDFGFKPYPYKHYESIFTRFYQGHILPRKFNVDKRRVHLSALVLSGQLSRKDALNLLDNIPYPTEDALEDDIQYFLKKMGWTPRQLEDYLGEAEIPHSHYPTEKPFWDTALKIHKFIFSR